MPLLYFNVICTANIVATHEFCACTIKVLPVVVDVSGVLCMII
jgi:hypothetical protein